MERGGGGLDGGGRRGGAVVAERVGDGVEEAARGDEGVAAGDGEVEEGGGCVLLGGVGSRVEGLGQVGDGAGFGYQGPALFVVLGDEPELRERLGSGLLRDGAELADQRTYCTTLDFHVHAHDCGC